MLRGCRSSLSSLAQSQTTIPRCLNHHYSTKEENIRMGPAVRFLLGKHKLQASKITPSGPKGTLLKWDVQKYIEKNGLKFFFLTFTEVICLFKINSLGDGQPPVVQKLDLGSSKKSSKKKPAEEIQQTKQQESTTQEQSTNNELKNSPHFYVSTRLDISILRSVTNELKG